MFLTNRFRHIHITKCTAVRDIATVNLIMKTGHSYSHWEYCRWCRRPPVTAGPVSPRRRWTGILACTERSCSLLLLWQLGVSIRRWLAAESNPFRSTCAHKGEQFKQQNMFFSARVFLTYIYIYIYIYICGLVLYEYLSGMSHLWEKCEMHTEF